MKPVLTILTSILAMSYGAWLIEKANNGLVSLFGLVLCLVGLAVVATVANKLKGL